MERKYMQPPEEKVQTRIGPQYQAQIPEIKPKLMPAQKRRSETLDCPEKKQNT